MKVEVDEALGAGLPSLMDHIVSEGTDAVTNTATSSR
jgi:hypothetical protein